MPLIHFADFQKYSFGTSMRTGPPWIGSSGSPVVLVRDEDVVAEHRFEREVRGVVIFCVLDHVRDLGLPVSAPRVRRGA